jgi:hypothetical protein
MNSKPLVSFVAALLLLACEDKPSASGGAPSASATAAVTAPAASSAAPSPSAAAAPSVSASAAAVPSASASAASVSASADTKEVSVTVKDPTAEPQKTVKAALGGSVTLYLPDFPGTVWSVESNDKTIGKAKEEVIPGFAPGTNGHQFQWSTKNPLLKSGGSHKIAFVNKKAGKPNGTFTLTIDIL